MRPRIKGVPAEILIRNIGCENSIPLESCKLSEILKISDLYLWLVGPYAQEELQQLSLTSKPVFDVLHLHFDMPGSEVWNLTPIISHFPPLRALQFYGSRDIIFRDHEKDFVIQEINTGDYCYLDVGITLSLFPQLETLEAQNSSMRYDGPPLILPSLKHLKVEELISPSFLPFCTCPNLETFHGEGEIDVDQEILNFILVHPSITTLHFDAISGMKQLVEGASQLQHLTVQQEAYSNSMPCFRYPFLPSLRTLTIKDYDQGLSCDDFEYLVRARCLPLTHPESELPRTARPLDSLNIVIYLEDDRQPLWTKSLLYREAKETIDDCDWEERTLSWVS